MLPGKSSVAGIGTSAIWMCLGYLAESILVIDERLEKVTNALTEGITLFTGMTGGNDAEKIKQQIKRTREEHKDQGYLVAKGNTLLATQSPEANIIQVSFRQPSGVDFKDRREYEEDIIAACFGEPLASLVIRGGVGYGVQSEVAAENASETGVGSLLHFFAISLGSIYPRVQVAITRPNDRAKRLNMVTFSEFAGAVQKLPEETLTAEEVRAIIDRDIIHIPIVGDDTVTSSASNDDSSEEDNPVSDMPAEAQLYRFEVLFDEDGYSISDEDVDRAISKAYEIDQQAGELLEAEGVQE
jgi:hypothetical protein